MQASPGLARSMHRIILFISFLFIVIVMSFDTACAGKRDVIPPMDMNMQAVIRTRDLTELSGLPPLFQEYSFNNDYLKKYTTLQYQISLIEQLIQRQSNIARIGKIYSDLGIPYTPPGVPEEICKKLPPNALCRNETIPGHSQEPDIKSNFLPEEVKATNLAETMEKKEEKSQKEKTITWAEINCTGDKCSAVVTMDEKNNRRRTITEGDILSDGSVVKNISFSGINVEKRGNILPLRPSRTPSRGGSSSPVIERIFDEVNTETPQNRVK